ncbi:MAG: hypothetical protein WDZ96_04945 [Acidimicrobiia bacterium]
MSASLSVAAITGQMAAQSDSVDGRKLAAGAVMFFYPFQVGVHEMGDPGVGLGLRTMISGAHGY